MLYDALSGPGLAFEVYPEALSRMPAPPVWSILFFVMMATLGFGSQVCFISTCTVFPISKRK